MNERTQIEQRLAELKRQRRDLEAKLNQVRTEVAQLRLKLIRLLVAQR